MHLGKATCKKIHQLSSEKLRHFQGRSPGCGREEQGPQLVRNRDRRYGRRWIKTEEICQYSCQEEVNHRWELSETGKSRAAQNSTGKLAGFVWFQVESVLNHLYNTCNLVGLKQKALQL